MTDYYYRCFECKAEYESEKIEKERIYLCPKCGSYEINQPLHGVLLIEYDFPVLRKLLKKAKFLKMTPGKFWLYPELWPLQYSNKKSNGGFPQLSGDILDRLTLPADKLFKHSMEAVNIFLWDETRNPTLSYKDRATFLVIAKAIQLGIHEISTASTGNAGSSLAGIAAKTGIKSHIFVPKNIPDNKRNQIQIFGSNIYMVDGDYDSAFDLCTEISSEKKWYNRNTAYNPLTIEGKKSAAYDIFISTKGKIPENIYIPVGDGVIIAGIYKGFKELFELGWIDKLPKLIGVQAEGSNAVSRYFKAGEFIYKETNTIADSIHAGAPRNLYMASFAVKESGGTFIEVSDELMLESQKEIAEKFGIITEPSAAASYAGMLKYKSSNQVVNSETDLLLITGNGLKDSRSLSMKIRIPGARSYQNWKDLLLNEK